MVNLLKTIAGSFLFLGGYFLALITQHVLPPMLNILEAEHGSTIGGLVWFGAIIVWALAMLVVPLGVMIWGIVEPIKETNPVFSFALGILWGLFSIAILYFTWYMVTPLVDNLIYDVLIGLFWMSLIIVWVMNIIVVPTYMIIEGKR